MLTVEGLPNMNPSLVLSVLPETVCSLRTFGTQYLSLLYERHTVKIPDNPKNFISESALPECNTICPRYGCASLLHVHKISHSSLVRCETNVVPRHGQAPLRYTTPAAALAEIWNDGDARECASQWPFYFKIHERDVSRVKGVEYDENATGKVVSGIYWVVSC
ncbi:hypothetical protein CBL_12431 [Carabus blaptoides fortunei]